MKTYKRKPHCEQWLSGRLIPASDAPSRRHHIRIRWWFSAGSQLAVSRRQSAADGGIERWRHSIHPPTSSAAAATPASVA